MRFRPSVFQLKLPRERSAFIRQLTKIYRSDIINKAIAQKLNVELLDEVEFQATIHNCIKLLKRSTAVTFYSRTALW